MQDISSDINSRLPFRGEFALAELTELSPEMLSHLGKEERAEFESFGNTRRQREYVTSRITLKQLSLQLGVHDFRIKKDELGQPYGIARQKKYYVSIAHTKQTVFCGVSEQQAIGIDVEPVDRTVSERLERRILHPDETEFGLDIKPLRLWTIKEAFIKLRGQGLRMNMNDVHVRQKGNYFLVEMNDDKRAKICSFRLENNWLAIAFFSNKD